MQNISDCSIREYQSIIATLKGHQALSPEMAQRVIPPYNRYYTAYFNCWYKHKNFIKNYTYLFS